MKEAFFYKQLKDKSVQCNLCPHKCTIKQKERGKCNVRENNDGRLYSLVYGKACSTAVDPIEKKPFFNFLPGTLAYSVATVGCNLKCDFCQNWEISQRKDIIGQDINPEEIVGDALAQDCKSISFTYTEPTIFFEYAFDIAKLAKKRGLKTNFVTNGFITKEAIDKIAPYLDAANIDLKGFTEDFYKERCKARLQPVLDAIKHYHSKGIWVEITTLIVPGHNDSEDMLNNIAEFIAKLDKKIPWHISRFYPQYKMRNTPATDIKTIHKAIEIGKIAGLKYIYAGNVPGDDYESTYCPGCKKKVIERVGFTVTNKNLSGSKCSFCGEPIDLIL